MAPLVTVFTLTVQRFDMKQQNYADWPERFTKLCLKTDLNGLKQVKTRLSLGQLCELTGIELYTNLGPKLYAPTSQSSFHDNSRTLYHGSNTRLV